ncbi:MAG: small multi-drug export protein [Clostridia bacterium]|nr:small multi-drug export protein [Clostridia bacterium]
MAEQVTEFLNSHGIPPVLIVFLISLFPILELRGGLIAAAILSIDWYIALPVCIIGTMFPIPFILLFIRKIFQWLKKISFMKKTVEKLEIRAARKSASMNKASLWGLYIFVAVPLPGTGAWTGSLIADVLDLRIKNSLPVIFLGTLTAGVIMTVLSYGFKMAL